MKPTEKDMQRFNEILRKLEQESALTLCVKGNLLVDTSPMGDVYQTTLRLASKREVEDALRAVVVEGKGA